MLKFRKENSRLILIYSGNQAGTHWIYHRFEERGSVKLNNSFELRPEHLEVEPPHELTGDNEFEEIGFVIATVSGEYYQIDKEILGNSNKVFIHKDVSLTKNTFVAERNISIFSKIDSLSDENIYIGGPQETAILVSDFESLLRNFPNSYELRRYAQARVGAVITNYIELKENSQQKYINYMNKKQSKVGSNLSEHLAELEVYRYKSILEKLKNMLADENSYTEKQWQKEILEIVLLLYPKYIHAFEEAPVRDTYNLTDRKIDFLLVDAAGNTDIIEIKKPFDQSIVTKGTYRDNHIPLRELSGAVMQVEKYIFHLNKWGRKGESVLTKRYESQLTKGLTIKVTNPSGMIIMGREVGLSLEQKQDFEVIKRKYKNIVDIVTYDDLLSRLEVTLNHWQKCV